MNTDSSQKRRKNHLVVGLGNDYMGDDAAGILAARELNTRWEPVVDVVETSEAGFALLDHLEGYGYALVLDTVVTGTCVAGTIRELSLQDFTETSARSPHGVGLHEVASIARSLEIPFPNELRILTMEVESPFEMRKGLSRVIADRLQDFVRAAEEILLAWGVGTGGKFKNVHQNS